MKIEADYYLRDNILRHYATGLAVAQHYDPETSYGLNARERKSSGRDCVDFIDVGWIKMVDVRLPARWSINFWYNARNFNDFQHFFTFSGIQRNFTFKLSPTYPGRPYIHFDGTNYQANGTIAATGWQMLTLSYDGSSFRIYINGKLSVRHAIKYQVPRGDYLCGSINEAFTGEKSVGLVSDFVIYDKLLSQAEVDQLYSNW